MAMTIEERVREILDSPACQHIGHTPELIRYRVKLRDCPVCLPKRIAAAIEAAAIASGSHYHGVTHCAGCAEDAEMIHLPALAALKGEPEKCRYCGLPAAYHDEFKMCTQAAPEPILMFKNKGGVE